MAQVKEISRREVELYPVEALERERKGPSKLIRNQIRSNWRHWRLKLGDDKELGEPSTIGFCGDFSLYPVPFFEHLRSTIRFGS
jgi:hypothetical protein